MIIESSIFLNYYIWIQALKWKYNMVKNDNKMPKYRNRFYKF